MNKGGNLPCPFAAQSPGSLVTMRLDPASPPGKTPLRGGLRAGSHRRWDPFLDNCFELSENTNGMSRVITPHFEKLIERFVGSGRFNNKSEVIRAGLRLLEEHEAKVSAANRDDLTALIRTALTDPRPLVPASALLQRRQRP